MTFGNTHASLTFWWRSLCHFGPKWLHLCNKISICFLIKHVLSSREGNQWEKGCSLQIHCQQGNRDEWCVNTVRSISGAMQVKTIFIWRRTLNWIPVLYCHIVQLCSPWSCSLQRLSPWPWSSAYAISRPAKKDRGKLVLILYLLQG